MDVYKMKTLEIWAELQTLEGGEHDLAMEQAVGLLGERARRLREGLAFRDASDPVLDKEIGS